MRKLQRAGRIALLLCAASVLAPAAVRADPSVVDPGLSVRTVASGLSTPTGMAFLGPDDMLVLEKDTGRVRRVVNGTVTATALDLAVNSASSRGLLGIALHPNFATNGFVYLFWTMSSTAADSSAQSDVALLGNRVDRFVWNGSALTFDRNIIQLRAAQNEAPSHANHNGGVIRFGPDGKLYVSVGDVGRRGQLQNLANGPFTPPMADDAFGGPTPDNAHLTGTILRLNDDGTASADNPFFGAGAAIGGQVGANVQRLFSYGIRNSFGMAFDPPSGALWAQENGDDSFDELNRVDSGSNSGWVQIMGPPDRISQYKAIETDPTAPQPFAPDGYLGLQQGRWPPSSIADTAADGIARLYQLPGAQFSAPEFSWKFSVAPGGLGFLSGSALGDGYANDLFVGAAEDSLKGGYLFHFDLNAARGLALEDPRLVDLVADNLNKFDLTESEALLFGCDFGATTDIQTGPNGNLFVVSASNGAVYEILPALPGAAPGTCSASSPSTPPVEPDPEPVQPVDPLSLQLDARKQVLGKRLKVFATASSEATLVAKGKSIRTRTLSLAADQRTKVAAKLRRKQRRRLAERLDKKGRAKARVKATATDSAGAAATDRVKVKLKEP